MPTVTPESNIDVFLSFATKDMRLVAALKRFLEQQLELSVYLSHDDLARIGSDAWIKDITVAIKNCRCFVPVLTRNSVIRPWVLYEAGIADAFEKPFCRVKSCDIRVETLKQTQPGPDRFINSVSSAEKLKDFSVRLLRYARGTHPTDEAGILDRIRTSEVAQDVIREFRGRSIFFAGSAPRGNQKSRKVKRVRVDREQWKSMDESLAAVVRSLTLSALEGGFTVSSDPYIACVGAVVAETVSEWCISEKEDWKFHYRIPPGTVGTHDLAKSSQSVKEMVRVAHEEHRAQVLGGNEWVIAIGGNRRTDVECKIALHDPTIKLLPIPIFGGSAFDAWSVHPNRRDLPVSVDDHKWTDRCSDRVIEFITDHRF